MFVDDVSRCKQMCPLQYVIEEITVTFIQDYSITTYNFTFIDATQSTECMDRSAAPSHANLYSAVANCSAFIITNRLNLCQTFLFSYQHRQRQQQKQQAKEITSSHNLFLLS